MVKPALTAAETLASEGLEAEVVNCRYVKPLDEELLLGLASRFSRFVTVEESAVWSGFGANVLRSLTEQGFGPEARCLGLPDRVIDHAARKLQLEECGLTARGIADAARALAGAAVRR
jgi:1-deoxy-D-xylulose-5-phosphate synthase